MVLQQLKLLNFKNCVEAELHFSDKINCFTGLNGSGKTNILDAIHYLSLCKSYFNPSDVQNILHNESFFSIQGFFSMNNASTLDVVSCVQRRNARKVMSLNKNEYERLADHIGLFPLVIITPSDISLIYEGSEERRRYLDGVISQFDRVYLNNLVQYNKALLQRNILLKKFAERNYFDEGLLKVYDEQLIQYGIPVFEKRQEVINSFIPVFRSFYSFISGESEEVGITYQSPLNEVPFAELLQLSLADDRQMKYSTVGIHKDDLLFTLEGLPLKRFGSQGQQKSFLVAIKLAQFEYTYKMKGYKPALLLDDIFDKLDVNRIQQMMKLVSENNFGQIFITDTHQERIEYIFKDIETKPRIFQVDKGKITLIVS